MPAPESSSTCSVTLTIDQNAELKASGISANETDAIVEINPGDNAGNDPTMGAGTNDQALPSHYLPVNIGDSVITSISRINDTGHLDGNGNVIMLSNPALSEQMDSKSTLQSPCSLKPADSIGYSMNRDDYHLETAIGFGSSAIVYAAKYEPTGVKVAAKLIELEPFERNQIDELRREIQVMILCKHPNVLRVLSAFIHETRLWIITPLLAAGSCLEIMKSNFKDGFAEPVIMNILYQALLGLEYLHRNGHLHRDVKAGNLLMDADGTVQLADFGVCGSTLLDYDGGTSGAPIIDDGYGNKRKVAGGGPRGAAGLERKGVRKTFVGTPCWMAPEVMEMNKTGYDEKADIWSFGITALELAHGHAPFSKYPPMKVIYLTLSNKPPTLDRKASKHRYSKVFKELIDSCLQKEPEKRPTAAALLKHPFFSSGKSSMKKAAYLVEAVLSHIPPLEQRINLGNSIKSTIEKRMLEGTRKKACSPIFEEEWDFTDDNEAVKSTIEMGGTTFEPDDGKELKNDEDEDISTGSNMSIQTRRGRFIVEQINNENEAIPGKIEMEGCEAADGFGGLIDSYGNGRRRESIGRGREGGEGGGGSSESVIGEVRKGRFSVMESQGKEPNDSNPCTFKPNMIANVMNNQELTNENGDSSTGAKVVNRTSKKSRFEITSSHNFSASRCDHGFSNTIENGLHNRWSASVNGSLGSNHGKAEKASMDNKTCVSDSTESGQLYSLQFPGYYNFDGAFQPQPFYHSDIIHKHKYDSQHLNYQPAQDLQQFRFNPSKSRQQLVMESAENVEYLCHHGSQLDCHPGRPSKATLKAKSLANGMSLPICGTSRTKSRFTIEPMGASSTFESSLLGPGSSNRDGIMDGNLGGYKRRIGLDNHTRKSVGNENDKEMGSVRMCGGIHESRIDSSHGRSSEGLFNEERGKSCNCHFDRWGGKVGNSRKDESMMRNDDFCQLCSFEMQTQLSHIDQLMVINDLMRQKLVDIRNCLLKRKPCSKEDELDRNRLYQLGESQGLEEICKGFEDKIHQGHYSRQRRTEFREPYGCMGQGGRRHAEFTPGCYNEYNNSDYCDASSDDLKGWTGCEHKAKQAGKTEMDHIVNRMQELGLERHESRLRRQKSEDDW